MTRMRFRTRDDRLVEVEAAAGACLLHVAQDAGLPLEGTCGGQMACGTCHVAIARDDWTRLPRATPDEEDMLDLVRGATALSRLSCQVTVPDGEPFGVTVVG